MLNDNDALVSVISLLAYCLENSNIQQKQEILSKETMFALKRTVITMCALSDYLLTTLKLQYDLLGKFQTNYLEFRFSQYSQMSGANYNVSATQIMESEKRLKNCQSRENYQMREWNIKPQRFLYRLSDRNSLFRAARQ